MPKNNVILSQLDAIAWLRTLPDQSVDLLITDPPYASLEKHRKRGTTTRLTVSKGSNNPWFPVLQNYYFPDFFTEVFRVLKLNRHFYCFCDQETMFAFKPMAEACGFKFWKPLVWDKCAVGMGYHYRARHEFILFFEKGSLRVNNNSVPDILACKRVHQGYPTEKPVPLLKTLIEQSSQSDWVVADPFMGSGSTGSAALALGRHFWGNDISDSALELSSQRLDDGAEVIGA